MSRGGKIVSKKRDRQERKIGRYTIRQNLVLPKDLEFLDLPGASAGQTSAGGLSQAPRPSITPPSLTLPTLVRLRRK